MKYAKASAPRSSRTVPVLCVLNGLIYPTSMGSSTPQRRVVSSNAWHHHETVIPREKTTHANRIYIGYMVVVQYSCLLKRPFFAKKTLTFAKLSRTLCFSFAGVHHVMKPFNLVGTRFLNTSARSVFGSAGGCYRQEAGVGAKFRWHMFSYMSIHGAVLSLKPRMPIASSCAVKQAFL